MVKLSSGIVLNPNDLTSEDREAIVKALEETKSGVWKPKVGEKHWWLDPNGRVFLSNFYEDEYGGVEIGNVFKTEEAAQKHLTYLKALQVLRGDTKGYEWKYGDYFHSVYYCGGLSTTYGVSSYGEPVKFKSRDDAESSIAAHEKEWRIVLGVE